MTEQKPDLLAQKKYWEDKRHLIESGAPITLLVGAGTEIHLTSETKAWLRKRVLADLEDDIKAITVQIEAEQSE